MLVLSERASFLATTGLFGLGRGGGIPFEGSGNKAFDQNPPKLSVFLSDELRSQGTLCGELRGMSSQTVDAKYPACCGRVRV